ncbi:MAG: hypothetical protein GC178_16005 [Flavobacteriales bacterium]|nr:hypothetical protein [Flavobacteriales bacterium]
MKKGILANFRIFLALGLVLFSFADSVAQVFEPERVTTWENAGNTTTIQAPSNQVSVLDFGADNTGSNSCNSAFSAALASLSGAAGTVYFPQGDYLFTSGISLPDSVFLKGESSGTTLKFDLGGTGNAIVINGSISSTQLSLSSDGVKGSYEIELSDASSLNVGDIIRLYQFDEDYMFSSWAYGALGQVVEIEAINGNTLALADPLNHHYPLSRTPYIKQLTPRRAVGIECLKIERIDASSGQTSNIYVNNAFNCVIRNVESENCNFAHLETNGSAHIQVEGCYFHHAFAYGGGGQGYGVNFQFASSFCKAQNNVFNHLRHSMLLQAGANGNVFGYNYSHDPFWEESTLPSNSAGDAVLHGNYTYLNLFEGNTIQNIVVDASHESNGPFNTFFRNRAELYGFFSDGNTPTDSMNVVGNEITNSGFPFGLFLVNGNGHYQFGNNVNETVTPSNTSNMTFNSLYLDENGLPDFLSSETLPMVGYPLAINQKLIPAETRFNNNEPVTCEEVITDVPVETVQEKLVKLFGNQLQIDATLLPALVNVYAIDGRLISSEKVNATRTQIPDLTSRSVYLIQVIGAENRIETFRTVSQ